MSLRSKSRTRDTPSPNRLESNGPSAPPLQTQDWSDYSFFETRQPEPSGDNIELDEFGFPIHTRDPSASSSATVAAPMYQAARDSPTSRRYSSRSTSSSTRRNFKDDDIIARNMQDRELKERQLSRDAQIARDILMAEQYGAAPTADPNGHPFLNEQQMAKTNRGDRIDDIVNDPVINRQLRNRNRYRPYFIYTASLVQLIMLFVSFGVNSNLTGQAIVPLSQNPMIGPSAVTLILLGARFVPCIKPNTELTGKEISCPTKLNSTGTCTVNNVCGLPASATPNQWWRFIAPIFLHGGILHILINFLFQIPTAARLEREFGWRIAPIYLISGTFGFVFGGNFAAQTMPSVGCSGALFGLIGVLLIDLLQNWKNVMHPWRSLLGIIATIIISFLIGLIPGIDNFSHIGGFIAGCLCAVIFLPTVHFGKWDRTGKIIARIVCAVILCLIFVGLLIAFYNGTAQNVCGWCQYLGCLPIGNLCSSLNTT